MYIPKGVLITSIVAFTLVFIQNAYAIEFLDFPRNLVGDIVGSHPDNNESMQRLLPISNTTGQYQWFIDVYPLSEMSNSTMNLSVVITNSTHSLSAKNITLWNESVTRRDCNLEAFTCSYSLDYSSAQTREIGTYASINRTKSNSSTPDVARFRVRFLLPIENMSLNSYYNISFGVSNSSGYIINKTLGKVKIVSSANAYNKYYLFGAINPPLNDSRTIRTFNSTYESTGIYINFRLNRNITGGLFEIAYNNETTVNNLTSQIQRFFEISVPPHFEENVSWNYIELDYSGVNLTGVNESALRLWWYNETAGKWIATGDVNTTRKVVYTNITHFSTFGVAEYTPEPEPAAPAPSATPSSASGSSSGGGGGSSSGSSSSSGGSTISAKPIIKAVKVTVLDAGNTLINIPSIYSNASREVSINNQVMEKVSIKSTTDIQNVEIKIERISALPDTPQPSGKLLGFLKVDEINITDDQIEAVNLTFKVSKNWILDNNINISTIALERYTGQWDRLQTMGINETQDELLFTAISPGLSLFAITGETVKLEQTQIAQSNEQRSKLPTGFAALLRPESYAIASMITVPLLALAYFYWKKIRK